MAGAALGAMQGTLTPSLIGASVLRTEDRRFLTGAGRYLGDLALPRMVEAVFVRSTQPHARLVSVEGPSLLTGAQLHGRVAPLVASNRVSSFRATAYPVLALDRVRFPGEAVALVVGESRREAESLAERVRVEYEPLEAVTDAEAATRPGAPALHDEAPDNVLVERSVGNWEDFDRASREAAAVVSARFRHGRLVGVPMEGRGCLAEFEPGRRLLRVWTSTQIPHLVRTYLAAHLGLPEHQVQVIAPDVGGGFGVKTVLYPEEVAVAFAALQLGRPVRWIEDRLEHMLCSAHAREQLHDASLAVDAEGRILALRDDILCDNGAYSAMPWSAGMEPLMALGLLPGAYRVPVYCGRCRGVATNKSPHAPYRGVARPATVFVLESLLDLAAARLGMDPVELRRRNLPTSFPHRTPAGLLLDHGSYVESLDRLCAAAGYDRLRREQAEQRRRGRYLGVGVSCFTELTGMGSATPVGPGLVHRYGSESAELRMDPSGGVTLAVGVSPHGQGLETTLAQVAADRLRVPLEAVRVVHGDTAATPYGMGTYASRSAVLAGGAVIGAAEDLGQKLARIGAHLLEADPDDVELRQGGVGVRGSPGREVSLARIAEVAHFRADLLPAGTEPGLHVVRFFDPGFGTFANGAHLAVVEVDPETGEVNLLRYVVVDDCGVPINPMIVEGQIQGAVAQGIGEALYEEAVYGPDGQLLTGSLMDYLVPTASEVPDSEIHHLVTPSSTPGGFKGVGEGGTAAAPAAIANAVRDALAPFGAAVMALPIKPDAVWRACRGADQP
jgi:carbon-monoxide dehydrogenase large subunit